MEAKTYGTNYRVATQWCNNSLILCNQIVDLDPSVYENMHFALEDEETGEYTEIYQWFLTDCSEDDVNYLEKTFGLLFTYSDLLDLYVLCVDHYGTSWDYVYCETTNEHASLFRYGETRMEEFSQVQSPANLDVNLKLKIRAILGLKNSRTIIYSSLL